MLKARCEVPLDQPLEILGELCEHYLEHGSASHDGPNGQIAIIYGNARLEAREATLFAEVEATSETHLAYMQMGIVHHLREFVGDAMPKVTWEGDGRLGVLPPFFRQMRVVRAYDVTPMMRRVVLSGEDLESFARGIHVRLVFPPKGRVPVWPILGEEGCLVWPQGEDAPVARIYTIRRIDLSTGEVWIDILRHDGDATPGSRFAVEAAPGDIVGMMGPSGGEQAPWRSLVLIGDETAIPAIARIIERLPEDATARAIVEVAGPGEEQPLGRHAGLSVEWVHRDAGQGQLADRFAALDWSSMPTDSFVWAGCEFDDFKAIRRRCRSVLKLPKEQHMVAAYWRRGVAEEQ
jgi:NADPH-dependent ferric siderophore reductase